MSQFSGFVAINFQLAGKILLVLGTVGLVAVGVSKLTGWFTLPSVVVIFGLVMILASLYLIYVVPGTKKESA